MINSWLFGKDFLEGDWKRGSELCETSTIVYQMMISNAILRYTRQTLSTNPVIFLCTVDYETIDAMWQKSSGVQR